jgi:MinD-like ATPase involved in chromosome partitioning or flagellar assembly
MSDDDVGVDGDVDDAPDRPDRADRRRQQAQGAAGDLARMGIDPRSLGLGDAPPARRPEQSRPQRHEGGDVLPLRPEYQVHQVPPPPGAGRPVPPPGSTRPPGPPPPGSPFGPPPPLPDTHVVAPAGMGSPPMPAAPAQPAAPVGHGGRETPRFLRRVAAGMVTPDAAMAVQGERQLIERVRARQSDRRVVAVIAGKGGVGCTTVATGLGTVLVAMRDDRSVLVDVQQGTPSLGALLRVQAPMAVASLLAAKEVVDPPRAPSGLGVIDGAGWDQGLSRSDVGGVIERLGHEHSFNLLDVGDDAGEGGHTALARADQVVIVTGAGPLGAAALQTAYDRVRQVNPTAVAGVVSVVVCQSEAAQRQAREMGGHPQLVVLPPEPHLAAGHPFDPAAVSGATREALLRLAGQIASRTPTYG